MSSINRTNEKILDLLAWLRMCWKAGQITRQSYSVDVPASPVPKSGCTCSECVDMTTYSGHAYIVGDWYIVIGYRRKDCTWASQA